MFTVREAVIDDVPAIQEIDRALDQPPTRDGVLVRAISEGKVVLAGSADGLVGYVRWDEFWDSIPLCVMMRVRPERQGQGIGRALYDRIEASFQRRGCRFWLSSAEETNERSRRFHESYGFRSIGKLVELGQDVAEVFYRKDIPAEGHPRPARIAGGLDPRQ